MSKLFLTKIVEIVGSQSALASLLATDDEPVKQGHVWGWINKTSEGIPARHVIPACSCVNWQVTPHELRPDLYPHPQDGLPDELRSVHTDSVGRHGNDRWHRVSEAKPT